MRYGLQINLQCSFSGAAAESVHCVTELIVPQTWLNSFPPLPLMLMDPLPPRRPHMTSSGHNDPVNTLKLEMCKDALKCITDKQLGIWLRGRKLVISHLFGKISRMIKGDRQESLSKAVLQISCRLKEQITALPLFARQIMQLYTKQVDLQMRSSPFFFSCNYTFPKLMCFARSINKCVRLWFTVASHHSA